MAYKKPTTIKHLGESPHDKYTRIPNGFIRDTDVSANGFRVGTYLLSLSDGWEVNQRSIATATGMSRATVASGIRNLVETGWLRQVEYRSETGHVYRHEYVMHRSHRMASKSSHMEDEIARHEATHMAQNSSHTYGLKFEPSLKEQRDTGVEATPGYVMDGCGELGSGSASADAEREAAEGLAVPFVGGSGEWPAWS
ncbi:HTH domain protein [Mycobacterium phage Gaia]|uniref:HTH domain protein n=1 Tax=Mycobacterium phage Gaia TaxID=1486472 RepID=A0A068F8Q0_9CAUD|nr:HTH domain protein [Mycobacterium phage Gaia]AID58885.1 HTH domain protein [Mycobacterium phage Gaia]AYR00005.1 helix-turn-helix DNA binding protein [Mycobacterium phage Nebkiss]